MRTRLLLPVFAVLLLAAPGHAAEPDSTRHPIRPVSQCLDLNRSPEIYVVDEQTLIAKTGPRHFRIDLMRACPGLNPATLRFELAPSARSSRRLCGEFMDKVITQAGVPCDIRGMDVIDKTEFKRLEARSRAR